MRKQAAGPGGEALAGYLALGPTLAQNALLQTVLECAMHVVQAGGAGLTLLDSRRKRLVFRAAVGDGAEGILGQEVPLRGSRHGLAFATGDVQNATPIYTGVEKSAKARFHNVLVAPLLVHGEPVGTISAVNKQGAEHFTAQDMAAYKAFADLAAVVVRQSSREELLKQGLSRKSGGKAIFGDEDHQLLSLFEGIAKLRRRHPDRLAAVAQVIEALTR